ncbi:hypothetical protein A2U01_0090880, partial [Trifolium medium]|nr:hypothetical protein [Trifolium medium]
GIKKTAGSANGVGNSSQHSASGYKGASVLRVDEGWSEKFSDGEPTVEPPINGAKEYPLGLETCTTDRVAKSIQLEEKESQN